MLGVRVLLGFLMGVGLLMADGLHASDSLPDDGSHIQITAPKNGETVGSSFELKYELHAGSQAHHAHVYLDGQYQKGFKGTFTNVPPGSHEIKVVAANKDHKTLPASATVTVTVK
jgi:hypothetical protein